MLQISLTIIWLKNSENLKLNHEALFMILFGSENWTSYGYYGLVSGSSQFYRAFYGFGQA